MVITFFFSVNYTSASAQVCDSSLLFMGPGLVTDGTGGNVLFGNVIALDFSNLTGGYDTIGIMPIDTFGNYPLENLAFSANSCDFLLLAVPDPSSYPDLIPTYLGNVADWARADTFDATNFTPPDTIKCVRISPQVGGTNVIRGYVISNITGKRAEPIEDEDIIVKETPPGVPRAYTQTDQSGFFEVTGLDPGVYEVIIEISGIPMDGVSNFITFSGTGNTEEITATVDSNIITLAPGLNTGIKAFQTTEFLKISPNPSNGQFKVSIPEMRIGIANLKIYNNLGKLIWTERIDNLNKETVEIDLSNQPHGIYYLEFTQRNSRSVGKVFR